MPRHSWACGNFGGVDVYENARALARRAFDLASPLLTWQQLWPPAWLCRQTFGRILARTCTPTRELIISTKAGFLMWPGPYGSGARAKLIASLDQSLQRLGLDYVDIYYHHRPDPDTPLEETMMALDHVVRQGKALYAGISNYDPGQTAAAIDILADLGTPLLIHQVSYSMFRRTPEQGLLPGRRRRSLHLLLSPGPVAADDKYLEDPGGLAAAKDGF